MDEANGPADVDWAAIHGAFTSGDPPEVLAARFAVALGRIADTAQREGWRKRGRKRKDQRQDILDAMYRILERQLMELETRLWARAQTDQKDNDVASKDMTALANMARTLDKLVELEKTEPSARPPMSEKETAEIRAKLAKRIDQYLSR